MADKTLKANTFSLTTTLLVVNTMIASGIIVRTGHLYRLSANSYAPYNWILGTAIIVLMCITALHAFTGYAVITGKKLHRQVITVATIAQIAPIAAVTAVITDPAILAGLVSSVATAIVTCALLRRTISK